MSAAEELKQRAAQLQDRLADQHVQFMQAAAQVRHCCCVLNKQRSICAARPPARRPLLPAEPALPLAPPPLPQQAPPEAAAKWQAEWSSAVREVSAAQDRLRGEASQGVDLHTADALSSVQRASDRLGSELEGLRRKGG